jgi:hypothetical protein
VLTPSALQLLESGHDHHDIKFERTFEYKMGPGNHVYPLLIIAIFCPSLAFSDPVMGGRVQPDHPSKSIPCLALNLPGA